MTVASAPGKIILFGEHAVVYGRPAIAVPVTGVSATATIVDLPPGSGCTLLARDLGRQTRLATAAGDDPLALIVRLALAELALPPDPDWQIEIHSQIPIASGLGSGAAVSTALARAVFRHTGREPLPEIVSRLAYRSEELHHGTPSGIDNTVIAYGRPVWFTRTESGRRGDETVPATQSSQFTFFTPARSFSIAIAGSGIASPTRETVGDVRRAWQQDPAHYEQLFDRIGEIVTSARAAMESGNTTALGPLMDRNQALLERLGVSSDPLRRLIEAARRAGALGAKLSGGGRGGNIIALVEEPTIETVTKALVDAGAKPVIVTRVKDDRMTG